MSRFIVILFFVIVFTFSDFTLNAFNLRGRVLKPSGKPSVQTVVINKANDDADYTDNEGYFNVEVQIGDTLQISNILYKSEVVFQFGMIEFTLEEHRDFEVRVITEEVLDRVNTLYLTEKYRACIAYCMHYLDEFFVETDKRHPFLELADYTRYLYKVRPVNIAKLSYLGTLSAYQYTLQQTDARAISRGFEWAKNTVALFEDYIRLYPPGYYKPGLNKDYYIKNLASYLDFSDWAISASECGRHFLSFLEEDKWGRKQKRWFLKKSISLNKITYKNTNDLYGSVYDNPLLEYKIAEICLDYSILFNKGKNLNDVFPKYFTSIVNLIQKASKETTFYVHIAINSLKGSICSALVEPDIFKKLDINLATEILIKLQDLSYYMLGSSRYTTDVDYTIKDIRNSLKENECAVVHFEAPVSSDNLYFRYDLGTRYRNYALVITRSQEEPEVWHRGYISGIKVNDLTQIKKSHPGIDKYYVVGTPRMSFLDFAGRDSSIALLHSLSQLLDDKASVLSESIEVTFIGDLNYSTVSDLSFLSTDKGGDRYDRLLGPVQELKTISELFENVRVIRGNDAKRNLVGSEICRSNSVVHISTHGITTSDIDDVIDSEGLALKENILQNSRLILSGYNDEPHSTLCSMTAGDVLELKKINAQIVFLDACLSGAGDVGSAGAVGMAEAFHLIGAENVICYLEPVKDNVATMFSNCFYRHLSKGHTCHDAFYMSKNEVGADIKVVLWE